MEEVALKLSFPKYFPNTFYVNRLGNLSSKSISSNLKVVLAKKLPSLLQNNKIKLEVSNEIYLTNFQWYSGSISPVSVYLCVQWVSERLRTRAGRRLFSP